MSEKNSITIKILGRDYQIACGPDEEDALRQAATYLNKQMEKVKKQGSTLGFEKIAVMTALNISYELLQSSQQADNSESGSQEFLNQLEKKIESALQTSRQFEI
ncbi:MAG: cell division protein ZapA [SAR86 cluster bacterium]|uniref:Cell division protein ZapA n=1 Tax=SAR86 cluster bacterium TaxID=2030880 RepID=A0A2A5CE40_9GAMM|nr:cell division protein ZapA [Gammaproteobacteria bacterium AH-315-E17]PCJ41781.1 MAG: cell division protein ZapA [SAR86 cluster bacterium]